MMGLPKSGIFYSSNNTKTSFGYHGVITLGLITCEKSPFCAEVTLSGQWPLSGARVWISTREEGMECGQTREKWTSWDEAWVTSKWPHGDY